MRCYPPTVQAALIAATFLALTGVAVAQPAGEATPKASGGYGAQQRTGAAAAADPIHGDDVMSGKDRSGPDGWSFAPVSRRRSPAQRTSNA